MKNKWKRVVKVLIAIFIVILSVIGLKVKVSFENSNKELENFNFQASTNELSEEEKQLIQEGIKNATQIDVTGTTQQNTIPHDCDNYLTTAYESNKYFQYCTVCGKDENGNYKTVKNIGSESPEITAISQVSDEWSKTKDVTVLATDNAAEDVQMSFNNIGSYTQADKRGNSYTKTFKLVGDVYENTKTSVFIKDSQGNAKSVDVTISKIDNTAPTITKTEVSSDKTKVILTANDVNTQLNAEGSGVEGYYYVFDNKKENDFNINEAEYTTSNEIAYDKNARISSYLHLKAVDAVGNISTLTNVLSSFALETTVNLDAADGKGGVDLEWGDLGSNTVYKAYQKKEGSSEWSSISTVNFTKQMDTIKVLNVYPIYSAPYTQNKIQTVTFTYKDGTTVNLPKSAALKVWMEGGRMNEDGKITTFEAYGRNPYTGQQLLKITPVSTIDFNNNPNIIWNYDVVMFGTWDTNGNKIEQMPDSAISVVEKYIQTGHGVLSGHDTIGYNWNNMGLSKLRRYFNIIVGKWGSHNETYRGAPGIDVEDSWGYISTKVKVQKQGMLTNFPWQLPLGATLTVPTTHSCANAAKGENVWMEFVEGTYWSGAGDTDPNTNYFTNHPKDVNVRYYLTTYNNTAMIQTGHSNCESTEDERKVLANTLFYLKQLTSDSNTIDNSAQDLAAPDKPSLKVTSAQNNFVSMYSNDNGTKYSFYVDAFDKKDYTKVIAKTNISSETVTTGVKGYYYVIDNNKTNNFDINKATYTTDDRAYVGTNNNGKYIHVKAVDYADNVSAVSDILIKFEEAGSLSKTASWVDANSATAQITLTAKFIENAEGITSNKPSDVIFVEQSTQATNNLSKEILTKLSNTVLQSVPGARIGIVEFGSSAQVKCNLTNNQSEITNAISTLGTSSTASYSAGLKSAIELIKNSSDASQREIKIVFLTANRSNAPGKGVEESLTLKKNYNAKIYGVGLNLSNKRDQDCVKNICGTPNFINLTNSDQMQVYNKIYRNVVCYTNKNIVLTDVVSNYFDVMQIEGASNKVTKNGNAVTWTIDEITTGSATIIIKVKLKNEYRFFDRDVITKYATNNQATLNYTESEVLWSSNKNHQTSQGTPVLNYIYSPERITVKVSGNKPYHGTEYFGLFTSRTSTKAVKYQSINYEANQYSTTFSVVPGTYYLYLTDSQGNKLQDSNMWYYEVESTEGYIEEVTDGFKISNVMTSKITQTAQNKPNNVYNDILTVVNTHNKLNLKRIWLTIAGNVSLDNGKDGSVQNDEGMKNIEVVLHTINNSNSENILSTRTDDKGHYEFKDQDIGYKHYVEFKYNGQYYEPTRYKANEIPWEYSSKAVDKVVERKEYNQKFKVITEESKTFTRDNLKNSGIIDQYGNLISNGTGNKEKYVENCIISAYTGYNRINNFYEDIYVTKTTKSELGFKNYDFTQYINLGLMERQKVDIAIAEDIFDVSTTINGRAQKYDYSKKEPYRNLGIDDIYDRVNRKYYDYNYSRELYKSDYEYSGENPLEVYVKYQIVIRNRSDEIAIVANEIANYYDEDYTPIDVYLGDRNGNKVSSRILQAKENSSYSTTKKVNGYKTLYITNNNLEIKVAVGEQYYIYVVFRVNKDDGKLKIQNSKACFAELNSYSTYYLKNTAPNRNNLKTQTEYGINDVAGIVEKDSCPGNTNLAEMEKLNKETMLAGKSTAEVINKYGIENDTDVAPSLKLTYQAENKDIEREISGSVWEDARTVSKYYSQIGNGTLEEGENKISKVKVKLINKNTNNVEKETQTDDNGNYIFTGFIPDDYFVEFVYGENGGIYNGQDYKSTVYNSEAVENFNAETPDADDKYNLRKANDTAIRQSDARDEYGSTTKKGTRQYVNNYCSNQGNGVTNELASKLRDGKDELKASQDFKENTYMTAKTGVIDVQIEYDRGTSKTSETGSNNIGNGNYDMSSYYKIANLDLGLTQRPKNQLELEVTLKNAKVTLSNGQTLFDASGRATNVMWISNQKTEEYYNGNLMKEPVARRANGQIVLTMDKELMHGATVQLTYGFQVNNIGEVDYKDTKFYYLGEEEKPYTATTTKAENTNIVTTTANTIISYIGAQLTDDENATRNNLHFMNEENTQWQKLTRNEITTKKLLETSIMPGVDKYETIIQTEQLGNKKLVPILANKEEGTTGTDAVLVETLTPETSIDDRTYNCMAEILKTSNDVGRKTEYSVVGNQNPTKEIEEIDAGVSETVTILPPFGQKTRREYLIVAGIVLAILTVGITGIIIFIKKSSKN